MKNEIIIYKDEKASTFVEVRVHDGTVWLDRHQLATLFNRDIKTIGKHISNALKEELEDVSVVAKFAITARDGKTYNTEHYNMDMVLSIGYRVKSKRGVQFRIWANKVIKDYLFKGYSVNQRINRVENDVQFLKAKTREFDLRLNTTLPPNQGIFYDGQVFDAYAFVSGLIKSAKKSILLIDNYIDESILLLFSKRGKDVPATIYTRTITTQLKLDLEKYHLQYPKIEIKTFDKSHDRFLIIDNETVYHIGASLKDLGKRWFAFSKINLDADDLIKRLGR